MGIVKLKKSKLTKFIFLLTLMFFGYTKVNAVQEVVLEFTNTKIKETMSGSGYKISGTDLSISAPGVYRLTGSSVEGSITVKKATTGVTIILDNLDLTSSKTAPLTINKDGSDVKLKLVGTNTLIDNEDPETEYSTDPAVLDLFEAAAIKVKASSSLLISGDGTLNAISNTKNAIKGGKNSNIQINSGTINLTSTKNGLSGDNIITINGGNITINADAEGIKLEPDSNDNSSQAVLTINGGNINITSGEDGIQAVGNIYINNKANITIDSGFDAIQTRSNFYMTNGTLNIHTYEGHNATTFVKDVISAKGIKASPSDDTITENAPNLISITGGTITIDSTDDAIHSDGDVTITRGKINIMTFDDGIHADSKVTLGYNDGLERDPEININDAYEGIEGGNIYIYSGKIKVATREDGINAAGGASGGGSGSGSDHYNPITGEDRFAIYAYGGLVYINSGTDGYDANGSLYLRGGTHIIHSQGRGGTNSALDRDAHLVIDEANVFTSGSIGTNGVITNIESNQEFIDQINSYDAGTKIAVKSNGNIIFNDTILKDTEYIFVSSPNLSSNKEIIEVSEIIEDYSSPWSHHDFVESITTPATPTTPGVKTYTCPFGYSERQTYFYDNDVIFNIYNKTNGNVSVTAGDITDKYDFTVFGTDQITVESDVDFYLISSTDNGFTFNKIDYTSKVLNTYTFTLDASTSQNLYIVYKGDANTSGYISAYDELLIRKSLLDPSDPLYRALGDIESIAVDVDGDGDIDEDDISYIQNVQLHMRLNYEYMSNRTSDLLKFVNSTDSITLDGENDGTVDVYLKANENIDIDAFEAMFIQNPYFHLTSIEPYADTTNSGTEINSTINEMLYLVNTDGFEFNENDNIYKLTFTVDKATPTGDYKLNLKVGVLTPHGTTNEIDFNLTTQIHVDGVLHPYSATFTKDEGVKSIDIFHTKNYATPDETYDKNYVGDIVAYARDKDTGIYVPDDSGQVHFRVNLKKGYVISSVNVEPTENYNKLNGPSKTDSADTYAITKINGDVTVTITTKQAQEYTATFIKDSGIKRVDVYYTHDYTTPDESDVDVTIARNDSTGEIDISGDGQVNFKVIPKNGYKIDSVTATGNYKNLKGSDDTGVEGVYRITKVGGDIIVDLKSKARENITLDINNLETNYEYIGKQITPEIIVKKNGEDVTLVKDVDYTITYGENTNLGTDGGSITITPKDNSDYIFTETTVYFNIVPYTLTRNNINVPTSIAITGTTLDPRIVVSANDILLAQDVDYTVTKYNLDGNVGENVLVTVQGIGNYTGLVENIEIPIVVKQLQELSFDENEVNITYGHNFIKTATLNTGNGTITYMSLTPDIATVNPFTGAVILNKKGTTVIKAIAEETEEYARTETQYILNVAPATLSVINITADDKPYDGTTDANISDYTFIGLVNDQTLVKDTDYTITANFNNSDAGENKDVTAVFTLINGHDDQYELSAPEYYATASIIATNITSSDITLDNNEVTYSGSEQTPVPTIVIGGNTLTKDTDYTVSYENNINTGTGYVVIEGIGNYKTDEVIKVPFTINKLSITPTIENIPAGTYNGAQHRPEVTVKYNNELLEKDVDYTVSYENNINASSEALVLISPVASSNYTFNSNTSKEFTINPYELTSSNVKLDSNYVKYDGTAKEPEVTIIANGIKLVEDIEYSVTYSNNINPSTQAKVTITAISSNYTANNLDVYFEITDKEVLSISGIPDNQKITYTGDEVILSGSVTVASNTGNISSDDLIVTYYDENNNVINRPINIGKYHKVYTYDNNGYIGEYRVDFEIVKAKSPYPDEIEKTFYAISGDTLSTVTFETSGISWVDNNTLITEGHNHYNAIYYKNNDSTNYEPRDIKVNVYGKHKVNINTSVDGVGGSISDGYTNVLEGTTKEIAVTPNTGFKVKSVTVDGIEVGLDENNKLEVTTETTDINVIASFEAITYELNISGTNAEVDPNGIIKVNHSDNESITITTKSGYRLTSALVNNTEKITDVSNNKLEVNNITEDTNIIIKAKKVEYSVIEGNKQTYTINKDNEATFKIDADYSLFTTNGKVYVDDNLVNSKNYTSKSGSIVITFNKDYLDTLDLGVHTLNIKLSDGGVAQTTFTIARETTRTIEKQVKEASTTLKTGTSKSYSSNTKTNTTTSDNNTNTDNTNIDDNKDTTTKNTTKKSSSNKASKNKQSKTNDNTAIYIILGVISLISILIIVLFKNDKKDDFID